MEKIYNPSKENWAKLLKRPSKSYADIEKTVHDIFNDVKNNGDKAIIRYTDIFDGVLVEKMLVSKNEILNASKIVSQDLKNAINQAKLNIEKFHEVQITKPIKVETTTGVICWQEKRAIQKVGLYIPGGTAPLFSTILMLAVPAQIAGCKEIILCSPPDTSGNIHPAILYTASLCGINKIFKVGGIQAIASMTFGTNTIPKVYKIFGPGNQYVTVAKQIAINHGVAIDIPAGPSELMVIADETANEKFVASDLLSQAEHGKDSQVVLVTTSKEFIKKVEKEVNEQLKVLTRKEIIKISIKNSKLIYCNTKEKVLDLINEYAPEHLIISTKNEDYFIKEVVNAGSIFIGKYTPESAGDYASGTNHTLPTNGYAKAYSGVNVDTFLKSITFQKISKKGLQNLGSTIEVMAEAEGLEAHKKAITIRLNSINNS